MCVCAKSLYWGTNSGSLGYRDRFYHHTPMSVDFKPTFVQSLLVCFFYFRLLVANPLTLDVRLVVLQGHPWTSSSFPSIL